MTQIASVMGTRKKHSVEHASWLLKKLYYVEREIMRTLGGYLVSVSDWELKKMLPVHLWQDSLRADSLRNRVLEMRYPRRDVDQKQDEQLVKLMSLPIRSANDRELVEAVYYVIKNALCGAYERYLAESDPLDDAPTFAFMKRFTAEIQEQISEIQPIYNSVCTIFPEATEWVKQLESYLNEIGGIFTENDSFSSEAFTQLHRPDYVAPLIPQSDPRFTPGATYHLYPKEFNAIPFIEQQIWRQQLISSFRKLVT